MPSSAYHRKQADTLTLLANSTRDRTTARALMRMAAEHVRLAEKAQNTPTIPRFMVPTQGTGDDPDVGTL
jgi:hypothetical protein